MKMQKSTPPSFEISIFSKLGFGKMKNLHLKFDFDFEFWGWQLISKSIPKIEKSAPQNLKFDFDFEFWG